VLELRRVGRPVIVALNMSDLARDRGYTLNRTRLESELGVQVIETVAVQPAGGRALVAAIDALCASIEAEQSATQRLRDEDLTVALRLAPAPEIIAPPVVPAQTAEEIEATQREARRILRVSEYVEPLRTRALMRLDAIVMNPIAGPLLLAVLLFPCSRRSSAGRRCRWPGSTPP